MASLLPRRSSKSPSPSARRAKCWSSGWYALALALLLVATGAVAPHAQGRGQGRGPQRRADRADRQLAERLNQGDGSDRERVIITLKPGAKRRLLQELQAYGERADQDFGVIDAFAGRIPRRLLRQLRNHPDVVSMSTDAPVTSMQVSPPVGTVYTVTNTNNSGAGSLRQAIVDANGHAGADTIWFNIPLTDPNHVYYRNNGVAGTFGTPVATTIPDGSILDFDADYVAGTARSWYRISPTGSDLSVTGPVTIDGTTQPGYSAGRGPVVEITAAGVTASDANAISLTTGASTVRGLVINSAGDQGIEVDSGAGGSTIVGNYIGTDVSGTVARANRWSGIGIKSSNVLVGGTSAADRNVISGNATSGYGGVEVYNSASGAIIRGNYIGTTATGTGVLANNGPGVRVFESATGARIGGVNAGEGNVIVGNSTRGVWIESGTGTSVLGNSIHGNGALGIDLATSGVLANDTGDGDTGANSKQNYPVLTTAVTTGSLVEITGTLNSTASSYFRVEFFSSPTADSTTNGEGQTYLGFVNVATTSSGNASFAMTLPAPVAVGAVVSATATKTTSGYAAFTDTSEFAKNVTATLAPYSLRSTLALDSATSGTATTTRTGAGVTVAVIDSGMLLDGGCRRPGQDDARLHHRQRQSAGSVAARRLRARHACGGPDRQQPGRRSRASPRACRTSACACSTARRRQHQPRDQGPAVGRGQQGHLRHRRHQPVAGPSDLRTGGDRPAGAGGGSGGARRHRRGLVGRQLRARTRSRARSATPASARPATRLGHHGRRPAHAGHGPPVRRPGGRVQLARADVVRRLREA